MDIRTVLENLNDNIRKVENEKGLFYESYRREQEELVNLLEKYRNSTEKVPLIEQYKGEYFETMYFPASVMNVRELKAFFGKKSGKIGQHCYRIVLRGHDLVCFFDQEDDKMVDLRGFTTIECYLVAL